MEEDTESTSVRFFYEQLDFISKRSRRERARKLDERVNRGLGAQVPRVRILVRSSWNPRM